MRTFFTPPRLIQAATFTLLLLSGMSLFAQTYPLEADEEQDRIAAEQAALEVEAVLSRQYDEYVDPCQQVPDVTIKHIPFQSFTLVSISPSADRTPLTIKDLAGRVVYKGATSNSEQLIRVDNNNDFVVSYLNRCLEFSILAEFSTRKQNPKDPLKVDRREYNAIKRWQESRLPLVDALRRDQVLTRFEKLKVWQNLSVAMQPLPNEYVTLELPEGGVKDAGLGKANPDGGCCCRMVGTAHDYTVTPIERIVPGVGGGVILGQGSGGSFGADRSWRGKDRQTVNFFGYFEGPARYQDLQARGHSRWANTGEYFWNMAENNTAGAGFVGEDPEAASEISTDFIAQQQWNWACYNAIQLPTDCGCERNINFTWEYESLVEARAEPTEDWPNSNARAAAVDAAVVQFFEDYDQNGESLRVLDVLINGSVQECETGRWQGPTGSTLTTFMANMTRAAFAVASLTTGIDDTTGIGEFGGGIDNYLDALEDIGEDFDDLFGQPWLQRTPCGAEIGRRRLISRDNLTGRRGNRVRIALQPNNPVTISLGAGTQLQVRGRKKYRSRATVSSSYRLATLMEGGGNPTNYVVDDCCSPYVMSWLYGSAVGQNVPARISDDTHEDEIRNFFASFLEQTFIFRESGDRVNRSRYPCPVLNEVLINGETKSNLFEDHFHTYINRERLTVSKLPSLEDLAATIYLYDLNGRLLQSIQVDHGQSSARIGIAHFPAGVYILSASFGNTSTPSTTILLP